MGGAVALQSCLFSINSHECSSKYSQKALDTALNSYIIIFTRCARLAEDQTIVTASTGSAESSSRSSAAREFSGQRVLRSARPGAGKVRDAPASGGRQTTGQPGSKDVWLLTSVVLSGTSRISRNWSCRTVAAQTRPRSGHKLTHELMQF